MAKTKAGKKRVYVREHLRAGSSVRKHYRSTPNIRVSGKSSKGLLSWLFGQ